MNATASPAFFRRVFPAPRRLCAVSALFLLLAVGGRAQTAGTLNASFNPGTGANSRVLGIARQADGKLLIGGQFTTFNGVARGRVARLNYDGSLDANFDPGSGPDSTVNAVAVGTDGRVVVGGDFLGVNGVARTRLARFYADGTLDLAFAPVVNGTVQAVAVDSDGRVYIAGSFTQVNGVARGRVARLLATTGQLDTTFDSGTGASGAVLGLVLQADGKVFIAGYFSSVNGVTRHRVARLNGDGTVDTTFVPGTQDNGYANFVSVGSDGKVLVGGGLYVGLNSRLLRLNPNGSVDATFNVGNNVINSDVTAAVAHEDGRVLIGGYFTAVNGVSRNGVARLLANGALDTSFNPGAGADGRVTEIVLEPDGSLVAGGDFTTYQGVSRSRITRIHSLFINQPPVMTAVPPQRIMDGAPTLSTLLTGIAPGPARESTQLVTNVTATSSDPALVPHPVVSYTPGATTATLAFTPALNATGTVVITVVLQDNGGTDGGGMDRSTNTFTIAVNLPNLAPSFALSAASVMAAEDSGARTFPGFVTNIVAGPTNELDQTVSFLVTSDNATLFQAAPAITTAGTLNFTPAANAFGTAMVTVRAQDNGGTAGGGVDTSAAQTFTLTVSPVNDAPQIGFASNVVVLEDSVVFAPTVSQMSDLTSGSGDAPGTPLLNAFTVSAYPAETNQVLTFTASAADPEGQPVEYRFNFGDGAPVTDWSTAATVTHSYATNGHYAATVQVRDPGGLTATRTLTVTVLSGPAPGLGARNSGPIALHPTSRQVWVVNPDSHTVQTIHADTLARGTERAVGAEPRSVAFDSAGNAWVTSHKADRIDVLLEGGAQSIPVRYGSAPFGIVTSPDGGTAYVSMFGSGEIVRFNTTTRAATGTLAIGPTPRALALNADGTRLYVTRFISARGHAEVWEVDTVSLSLLRTFRIAKFGGDEHRDSPSEGKGVANFLAGMTFTRDGARLLITANKLNADKGAFTGADLDEENSVRNLVIMLDVATGAVVRAIDMDNSDSASAVALSPLGDYFFTTLQGNNDLAIFDAFQAESSAGTGGRVSRRAVGSAPQGIAVDPVTRRAFVQNLMSRNVTVLELGEFLRTGAVTLPGTNLTTAAVELMLPQVRRGKEIFYNASDRRMSSEGYISCASCHVDGGQDGRVWDFSGRGEGLRNTIALQGRAGILHGNVHWSANFDEIQDFEHDMRGAFGGTGFLTAEQFAAASTPLGPPKAGMSADLDALAAYVSSLSNETVPRSPHRAADGTMSSAAVAGATVFAAQNCASCHSSSTMRDGQMHNVGTLRPTSGQRLRGLLTGIDTPTLRGVWGTAPYFHDGSAATLEDVFRVAGGALYPAELAVPAGSTQVVSNDLNYVLNYDETAFGKAFVILGSGATLTFSSVSGGTGGLGAVEVRYGNGPGSAPLTVWVNGTNFSASLPQPFNDPPERLVNWLTYRFEDLPLRPGTDNTIVLEAGGLEVLVDHIVVSTPDDFALAEPHRRVLALTSEDRANLLAFVRELDGNPLPGQVDATFVTVPPVSATVTVGASHTFSAAAIGSSPLSYQWLRNNEPVPGANGTTLTLAGVTSANSGSYAVQVSGPGGTVTSLAATLQVVAAPPVHPGIGFASATSVGPANESGQSITNYTVSNNRPALFSTQPAIAANGQLTFIPAPNAVGSATVTVVAQDNGGTANGGVNRATNTFTITVGGVNDAPSFALNASLLGGAGPAVLQTAVVVWGKSNVHQADIPAGLTGVTTIEAGWYHNFAIRHDGTLVSWGWNDDGQANVPADLGPVRAAAGGWDHSLALRSNGTVVAWGRNDFGQATVPAGLTDVMAIAASEAYSLALKSNGTIVAWGRNDFGQATIPAGLTGVTAISAGREHGLALKSDGTVAAWGNNNQGQRNVPAGLSGVIAIDAGREHNLALKSDGTVVAWGYNGFGQATIPAGLNGVAAIAAGDHHNMVLKRDGTILAWGRNDSGQSTIPAGLGRVLAIGAGGFHNMVLVATGGWVSANPLTVLEDSGPQTVSLLVTNLVAGPADESGQLVSLIYTNDNPALFSSQPAIAANGTLTFTPAANAFGTATVTVRAQDNGGTANGGADTSAPQSFVITVTPVNEPPSIAFASNVVVLEDSGAFSGNGFVNVTSLGTASESGQSITNYTVSNNNPALFASPPAIATNGTLTFTPAPDANGVATVTVIAQDNGGTANGGANSTTGTFTLTVASVNDAPEFTLSRTFLSVPTNSGATSHAVIASASVGPAAESGQVLSYLVANDSPGLFLVPPSLSAAGNLSFTVASGQSGLATLTIRARDSGGTANGGVDTSAPQSLMLVVGSGNQPPASLFAASLVVVPEDVGVTNVPGFATFSPGPPSEGTQTVSVVSVTAANPALFATAPALAANGTLSFTPAPNANGSSLVTVVVLDNGGTANGGVDRATNTFTISVTAVNDPPGFVLATNALEVLEDSGGSTNLAFATSITAGPANESGQVVSFTVTNDNQALFSSQPALDINGRLTFTPATNASGSATITVLAQDNGGTAGGGGDRSATQTFTITVTPVNDPPAASFATNNLVVLEDAGAVNVAGFATFSPGPLGEGTQTVSVVSVTAANPALFATAPALAANGTLSFTPAPNANGSSLVTVVVRDDGGTDNGGAAQSSGTFIITVSSVNDAPSFTLSTANHFANTLLGAQTVAAFLTGISAGPADEAGQGVVFNVSNSASNLFAVQPVIAANGTLTFTPVAGVLGAVTVTVVAVDTGGTAGGGVDRTTNTFVITLAPGNVAPSFTKGADQLVFADDGAVTVANWATSISVGPAHEAGQAISFVVTNSDSSKFTVPPAVAANGTLTFTPVPGAVGVITVGVGAVDDGGTDNGGVDTSAVQTFTISLAASKVFLAGTPSAGTGESVTVPVSLLGAGAESGLTFTLSFPRALLTFDSASAGGSSAGASVLVNANTAGQVGVVVTKPLGEVWPAGSNEVVLLTFSVAGGAVDTNAALGFGDAVVMRQVSDTNAVEITPVLYVGGSASIQGVAGLEGDVSPRSTGNGRVTVTDALQISRFTAGLDTLTNFGVNSEFQRADTAPRATLGDGRITVIDAIQAQRYAAGLDPATPAGGPTGLGGAAVAAASAKLSAGARVVRVAGGNLVAGRANKVIVQVDAQGDEAGLSLSLAFDPGALTFVSAAAGQGAGGAALVVNASRAAAGRVGLVLMLPAGSSLAAGTQEVVTLTFNATGSGPTAISVTGDAPVAREVADVNANVLGASFVGGSFNILLPVSLKAAGMERAADGSLRLVIRNADGTPVAAAQAAKYEVQVTCHLGGSWTVLPNALVVEGGALKIVDPAAHGAGLRLYKLVEKP